MSEVRFIVEKVFDLPQRGGIILSGKLVAGTIKSGMMLRDETTGRSVRVVAVEFPTPRDRALARTTIVIDRQRSEPITASSVLTDASDE